jgi:hypothetical protein
MPNDSALIHEPANLVGTWRRFGVAGPVYEIIEAGKALPNRDRMMRIRVVESGEKSIIASPKSWTIRGSVDVRHRL